MKKEKSYLRKQSKWGCFEDLTTREREYYLLVQLTQANMSAEKSSGEIRLQEDIDKLKDPTPYQEKFGTLEAGDIQQALDILRRLQLSAASESTAGWEKIENAIKFLEGQMKKHIETDK